MPRGPRRRRSPRAAPTPALRGRARAVSCARRARCTRTGSCGTPTSSAPHARAAYGGRGATAARGTGRRLRAPSPPIVYPNAGAPARLPTATCRCAREGRRRSPCANADRHPARRGTRCTAVPRPAPRCTDRALHRSRRPRHGSSSAPRPCGLGSSRRPTVRVAPSSRTSASAADGSAACRAAHRCRRSSASGLPRRAFRRR